VNRSILFHTCLVNEFFPSVGFAVVKVLRHLGYDVQVPLDQTCCGQPAFNAGFHDAARTAARHTIALLERTEGEIVIPSGSCGDMVVHQYCHLFEDDPGWRARAEAVAARSVEFSVLAARHLERLAVAELRTSVAYHPSCHLARGLGIDAEPRRVIAAVRGVEARTIVAEDDCCGFGGLFSIKHADISSRMLERKLDAVTACGADRLVSCDLGCLLHLGGGLHRRGATTQVQHLAELLDEALPTSSGDTDPVGGQ
jgi:L-lactate dehydrogenase complex protein LldE